MQEDLSNQGWGSGAEPHLLPSFRTCYFCGTENEKGLGIRYFYEPAADRITGRAKPEEIHCGYPGILHGGLQSALLDDVMYWAVMFRTATSSVTLEITCRFRKTAELGRAFLLQATSGRPEGRKARARGELLNEDGALLAEASGLYLLHPRDEFLTRTLPYFDFQGCSEATVRHFQAG